MWLFVGTTAALLAAFTAISAIVKFFNEKVYAQSVYVAGIVIIVLILTSFVIIVNKSVVRRVETLNDAVHKISDGNYDLTVPARGNDELTELSKNFNKMTAELRANAFLSKDFARYVSHEFKTPLAVIRSYAESVMSDGLSGETNAALNVIISETDRLAAMTGTILQLCRLDSTNAFQKNDVFYPAEQIRAELRAESVKCKEKNLSVDAELCDFEITGNENLTRHVWQNLISNALKFTNRNGNVFIRLEKIADSLVFRIKDDGIGISEEDKDKVFDMFFTGDKSHNADGCGLGLPLTKKIVEKSGGEISFTSERDKGTEFIVTLPV